MLVGLSPRGGQAADEAPKPAEPGSLIIIDANGKEQKLKAWTFAVGTRHLTWLAPATAPEEPKDKKDKAKSPEPKKATPAGPEALEFRDDHSTDLARGILTLIPLDRLRSIDYDNEKQIVTVRVATSDKPEEDLILKGTTKFAGENKLVIAAEVDKGDMGIAEVKFLGGTKKAGAIKGVRFPPPKVPAAVPTTRAARITATDKAKTVHKVTDLHVLYEQAGATMTLSPTLTFKKTLKVDLAKVKKMKVRAGKAKEDPECDVSFAGGEEQTLTVLRDPQIDGKRSLLEGFIGRSKAGYLIFPLGTVAELQLDDAKE
jgi:hypothetical protein